MNLAPRAIHALAPRCTHCGCRVIGHGVDSDGVVYCCANCARKSGVKGVDDRVDTVETHAARRA